MNVAVPYAASILAEMGADVWKLEPPDGDSIRTYAPLVGGMSTLFASLNREKRYLSVGLKSRRAQEVFGPLVERADVVLQNFRPHAARTLGVDAGSIHDINPDAVHVSVEAFYPDGTDRPGLDLIGQAESGFMDQTGEAGGEPCRLPASIIDYVTGMWVAMATLSALGGPRDRTAITVTMMDVALSLLGDKVSAYLATGVAPQRMGSALSTTTPHQAFRTSDGYVVVGAPNEKLFQAAASVIEPALLTDERFATSGTRLQHRAELVAAIEARTARDSTDSWVDRFGAAGVPATPVTTLPEAVAHHQRGGHPRRAPRLARDGPLRHRGTEAGPNHHLLIRSADPDGRKWERNLDRVDPVVYLGLLMERRVDDLLRPATNRSL